MVKGDNEFAFRILYQHIRHLVQTGKPVPLDVAQNLLRTCYVTNDFPILNIKDFYEYIKQNADEACCIGEENQIFQFLNVYPQMEHEELRVRYYQSLLLFFNRQDDFKNFMDDPENFNPYPGSKEIEEYYDRIFTTSSISDSDLKVIEKDYKTQLKFRKTKLLSKLLESVSENFNDHPLLSSRFDFLEIAGILAIQMKLIDLSHFTEADKYKNNIRQFFNDRFPRK